MPKLLKNGALIEDAWTEIGPEDPLPAGPVIVPAARLAEVDRAELGVRLPNTFNVETLAADLPRLQTILLEFPKFTDGRAYTQAHKLRELGFKGEIRAVGQVLPDQLLFMHRCGFDAFVLAKGDPIAAWNRSAHLFTTFYQPAADDEVPAFLRHRESASCLLRRRAAQKAAS